VSHPTFASNKDRLTYLLAEYKLLVFGMLLGALALVWYYQPVIPSPPAWAAGLTVAWILFGPLCFPAGVRVAKWLHYRNWEEVHHINAVEDVREKWMVPPDTWKDRETDGPAPNLVNDGDAYEVREFEWLDDIEQLRVRGTWLSAAKDGDLVTSRTHMERIHDGLLDKARTLAELAGQWSDRAIQMQENIIMSGAEARERGQLVDKDAARDVYQEMRGDVDPVDADEFLDVTERDLAEDERPTQNGHHDPTHD